VVLVPQDHLFTNKGLWTIQNGHINLRLLTS
jgi:hypothetical protein